VYEQIAWNEIFPWFPYFCYQRTGLAIDGMKSGLQRNKFYV